LRNLKDVLLEAPSGGEAKNVKKTVPINSQWEIMPGIIDEQR
jgi:hypothetical protein